MKKFLEELRVLIILIIIAFTIKTTLVEIYVVPTGSMENEILTGDMLIGNKFIYGMRTPIWIGIPYTRIGFDIPWWRLPKFKEVENGDVTIFEFPRDPFQKYVKRCIGIPGDSIYVDEGDIFINGELMPFPEEGKYIKGFQYGPDKVEKLYSYFTGNRDNMSGFQVPYKGMDINFFKVTDWQIIISLLVQDGNEVTLGGKTFTMIDPYEVARTHGFLKYKLLRLISSSRKAAMREQKDRTDFINNLNREYKEKNLVNPWYLNYGAENADYLREHVKVNGASLAELKSYTLKRDYYFFMGDNRDSSYDSRFWGFVPDTQILGTPLFAMVNLFKFKLRMKVIS
ncbi:MAG: signal peptidase I [Candidatus Marinimicrobia bacterium]|nr:signal peptidase I [Candidatus Neomarinimicrobiota bacterium]